MILSSAQQLTAATAAAHWGSDDNGVEGEEDDEVLSVCEACFDAETRLASPEGAAATDVAAR